MCSHLRRPSLAVVSGAAFAFSSPPLTPMDPLTPPPSSAADRIRRDKSVNSAVKRLGTCTMVKTKCWNIIAMFYDMSKQKWRNTMENIVGQWWQHCQSMTFTDLMTPPRGLKLFSITSTSLAVMRSQTMLHSANRDVISSATGASLSISPHWCSISSAQERPRNSTKTQSNFKHNGSV